MDGTTAPTPPAIVYEVAQQDLVDSNRLEFAYERPHKGDQETYVITSIDELLDFDDWDDARVLLSGDEHAVWRGEDRDRIRIKKAKNLILDGGDQGITIYGHSLKLDRCKDVTLRNLTIRLGAKGFEKGDETEALSVEECRDIKIENCSFSWGTDETVSIVSSKDVELLNCIISEPLDEPLSEAGEHIHSEKTPHGYGCLIRGSKDVKVKGCLIAHCSKRSPSVSPKGKEKPDVRVESCVIFDYGKSGTKFNSGSDSGKGNFKFKIYENHYLADEDAGPAIHLEEPGKKGKLKVRLKNNRDQFGNPASVEYDDSDRVQVRQKDNDDEITSVEEILNEVGPKSRTRTATDSRILAGVRALDFKGMIDHESEVPEYSLFEAAGE